MINLMHGDCLEVLRTLPDNSVDAVVTDPPYGLSFMGKKWDYDVPATEVWAECLRVLKPGGHLLAFAGTRTQHRMAVRIEDAGFEIRDMIAWVYGCLSEDSEVLTEDGWMPYNRAKQKNILAYDLQNDVYQWERPSRWNEYRVESDTAYRIQSDHTDQIVSRGHRCVVERGGMLEFVSADELSGLERMPYLQGDFSALPEGSRELLLQTVLREGEGLAQETFSQWQGKEVPIKGFARGEKSGVEGRRDILQAQGQVRESVDQIRSLPCGTDEHGPQRRVCDGASACGCSGDRKTADAGGMCAPHQPRCDGQQAGEPDAVCQQRGSQTVRARASYQTTLATVTAVEYSGLIWCPTVSTGAFVARRNGKVFITGNSGFPKSLDVSKAIDKAAGAEREKVLVPTKPGNTRGDRGISYAGESFSGFTEVSEPVTEAARQWQGWGTALKPALEPVTVARKPLSEGTVAANVLAHGTGAINVDGCRVNGGDSEALAQNWDRATVTDMRGGNYGNGEAGGIALTTNAPTGRWPANLIHDGSEEVVGLFPDTKSGVAVRSNSGGKTFGGDNRKPPMQDMGYTDTGSAARFFYCAKASKRDRDEGLEGFEARNNMRVNGPRESEEAKHATKRANNHPTVKPTDLMRYLCRLVTPPGGIVLDPFMGSGSTGKAARLEGFQFIGIEREEEYLEIARARINAVQVNLL